MNFYSKLDAVFRDVEYGKANINITIHNGKPVYFIGEEFINKRYKKDHIVESTKDLLTELKEVTSSGYSGTITFSLELNDGLIKQLHIHKAKKHYIDT